MLESRGGLVDLVVADLYCGSGAMGIEALSRGAAKVYFVDSDPACLAAARAHPPAFACRQAQIHPQIATESFALVVVPRERTPQKREERLAEARDCFGFGLAGKTGAGGAWQGAFDVGGDQQKRFALDGGEQFGLVFGFAGDPEPAVVERIAVHEARGALLLEHETYYRAGGGAGTGG